MTTDLTTPAAAPSLDPTADDLRRMHPVALAAVVTAVMVPIMSFFNVNVALGQIGRDLDAGAGALQLVVAAYGAVYASMVILGGRLGDGYGRKRMLQIGLAGFAATSLLCSVAQTPGELVGARLLQGLAAALVTPQVLATIHASTDGHHRTRAIGWFGATAGIASSLGFLVGGALAGADATWLGWRAIFWVNVPVVALAMVGIARHLPETRAPERPRLDVTGATLLAVTMALLILPLTEGRAVGWPTWTWLCLAAFVPAGITLLAWQGRLGRRGGLPLVPLTLFRFRSIAAGLTVAAPFFLAFGGFMFVYSLLAQAAGMSPLRIGLSLLPMAVAFLAASLVAGRLVPRYGVRVLTLGAVLAAVGYAAVGWTVHGDPTGFGVADVMAPMVVGGVGLGLVMSPLMGIVLSQVPAPMAGIGSGLLITTQQACLGLGSALVGSLFLSLVEEHGPATGFWWTAVTLAVALLVIAGLTRLLEPRR